MHVRDLADFVLLVLKSRKSIGQVYNIANHANPPGFPVIPFGWWADSINT
jgi:nucleoside-diphosphate-sugar epimerase